MLAEARALILDPAAWCQGEYALDKDGETCLISQGVRFCAIGALVRAGCGFSDEKERLNKIAVKMYGMSLMGVNDSLGHEAVISVFDAAL